MNLNVPKTYVPGLGYSPASGPAVGGGFGVDYSPEIYSSTFFGSDVKGLFPRQFGKTSKRTHKRTRKSRRKSYRKRTRKQSRKRSRKHTRK